MFLLVLLRIINNITCKLKICTFDQDVLHKIQSFDCQSIKWIEIQSISYQTHKMFNMNVVHRQILMSISLQHDYWGWLVLKCYDCLFITIFKDLIVNYENKMNIMLHVISNNDVIFNVLEIVVLASEKLHNNNANCYRDISTEISRTSTLIIPSKSYIY